MSLTARFKKRFYFVAAGYFRWFANHALRRWSPRVIAITGSVGKTTMLHLVEFELGARAHYSHDANSAFGIAFDLVGVRGITGSKLRWLYLLFAVPVRSLFFTHGEEFYIVEIDGERPRETGFLAEWLRPEVTLWISLGLSHAVQFESQVKTGEFENLEKAIAHEFAMLPEYTTKRILIDADVHNMERAAFHLKHDHHIPAEVVNCHKTDLDSYQIFPDHAEFTVKKTKFYFAQPQPKDIVIQLVMLKQLCRYLKIPLKTDFSAVTMPPGRSNFLRGKNGVKIIDSSYNAHLISMASILEMTRAMKTRHKWLVIGDLVDQGSIEGEEHRKLAKLIKQTRPEQVVLVGPRTRKYTFPKLKSAAFPVKACADAREALEFLERSLSGRETVIFKGSQYLEWIIERLLADPADVSKLARRDKGAARRRAKHGLN